MERALDPDNLIFLEGDEYDEAIVGVTEIDGDSRVVYSEQGVIAVLLGQGMSRTDALDFYYHNIEPAYVGENSPVFVDEVAL